MQKLFGSLLLGCGIIFAGLSGLCTLLVAGSALVGSSNGEEMMSVLPASLIFGGVPIAIGIGMFFGGRALLRSAKADEPTDF
jgi:hypothetical protein